MLKNSSVLTESILKSTKESFYQNKSDSLEDRVLENMYNKNKGDTIVLNGIIINRSVSI